MNLYEFKLETGNPDLRVSFARTVNAFVRNETLTDPANWRDLDETGVETALNMQFLLEPELIGALKDRVAEKHDDLAITSEKSGRSGQPNVTVYQPK
jgi:hypothetical protein